MCTLVILRRPGHDWPVLLAANRDEMLDRAARPPGRHWPERPNLVAGYDALAGGSWLGLNDDGVAAGVLNRTGSLGPDRKLRSRGELVLEALDHADAITATDALSALEARAYHSFNLVVVDNREGFWLRGYGPDGPLALDVMALPPGLSMITAHDLNDAESRRIRRYLPRFRAASAPDPATGDWGAWQALLASRTHGATEPPEDAMTIVTSRGFGTVSSSLVGLPAPGGAAPRWLFADGRPDQAAFRAVTL